MALESSITPLFVHLQNLVKDIEQDNEERVGLYFDHGLDINVKLKGA